MYFGACMEVIRKRVGLQVLSEIFLLKIISSLQTLIGLSATASHTSSSTDVALTTSVV